jgi:hypothetical protein
MFRIKCSETSGITILLLGIVLLLITFIIASIHLQGNINVLPVPSLMSSLGAAFSPILEAAIRVLYMGVMGLIATKVIAKGITILFHARVLDTNNMPSGK